MPMPSSAPLRPLNCPRRLRGHGVRHELPLRESRKSLPPNLMCRGSKALDENRQRGLEQTVYKRPGAVVPLDLTKGCEPHARPRRASERPPSLSPSPLGRRAVAAGRASGPCPRGFGRPVQNGRKCHRKGLKRLNPRPEMARPRERRPDTVAHGPSTQALQILATNALKSLARVQIRRGPSPPPPSRAIARIEPVHLAQERRPGELAAEAAGDCRRLGPGAVEDRLCDGNQRAAARLGLDLDSQARSSVYMARKASAIDRPTVKRPWLGRMRNVLLPKSATSRGFSASLSATPS